MEVHICNNCRFKENCKERFSSSFLYCVTSNIRNRDIRNDEFFREINLVRSKYYREVRRGKSK